MKDVVVRRLNGIVRIREVVQRRVQFERVSVGMRMMMGLRMKVVIEGMIELMTLFMMRLRMRMMAELKAEWMLGNEREKRLGMIDYG